MKNFLKQSLLNGFALQSSESNFLINFGRKSFSLRNISNFS